MKYAKLCFISVLSTIPAISIADISDTKINFNASITPTTCRINVDTPIVNMENLTANILNNTQSGQLIGSPEIFIIVTEGCENSNIPTLSYKGEQYEDNALVNHLNDETAAKGVSLVLIDSNNNDREILPDEKIMFPKRYQQSLPNGQVINHNAFPQTKEFTAIYKRNNNPLKVGAFKTSVNFYVEYK